MGAHIGHDSPRAARPGSQHPEVLDGMIQLPWWGNQLHAPVVSTFIEPNHLRMLPHATVRSLALAVAGASKIVFIALVLSHARTRMTKSA